MFFCGDCKYFGDDAHCPRRSYDYMEEACMRFYNNPTIYRRKKGKPTPNKHSKEYRRKKINTKKYAESWVKRMCKSFSAFFSRNVVGVVYPLDIPNFYRSAVCNIYKVGLTRDRYNHAYGLYVNGGYMRLTNQETGKSVEVQMRDGDTFDVFTGIAILWARYRNKPVPEYLLTDHNEKQEVQDAPVDACYEVMCEITRTSTGSFAFICPDCGHTATVAAHLAKLYTQEHKFCCKCGAKFRYNMNLLPTK